MVVVAVVKVQRPVASLPDDHAFVAWVSRAKPATGAALDGLQATGQIGLDNGVTTCPQGL